MTWLVLLVVLYSVVSAKLRYDLTAFAGLLFLGIVGLSSPGQLFSGFSSPALFTIATVLVMSAGIVESGLLAGFGKKIADKIHHYKNQIFALFVTTGLISAFMNNIGAIGIVLPTAKRMAQRAKVSESGFGLSITFASILGGSLTLIGTASNLIVSTFRMGALGEPFKMFDFFFHGLTMLLSGLVVLFFCRVCGLRPMEQVQTVQENHPEKKEIAPQEPILRDRKKSLIVLFTLVPAVVLTAIGLVHPAIAFGVVTLAMIGFGILPYQTALT
ncbi:MAG: hypothetical protein EOM73_14390, partial [Bacteroidia bacterium]|nr:hypothetical protein [Bacteroidia bacterium]